MTRPFEMTKDNERLLRMLQASGKVPRDIEELTGLNLFEVRLPEAGEDDIDLATIFGPLNGSRGGRATPFIALAREADLSPVIGSDDRLHFADIGTHPDRKTPMYVKPPKEKTAALRLVTTGLLLTRKGGGILNERAAIRASGKKLRYHGVFPLTADAASVVGEGIDLNITDESKVVFDERFGSLKGVAGVPTLREALVRAVVGGPLLVGQVDGDLKILELLPNGMWKKYDVTDDAGWQQRFMDLAEKDMKYLDVRDKDESDKQRRRFLAKLKVVRTPGDDEGR